MFLITYHKIISTKCRDRTMQIRLGFSLSGFSVGTKSMWRTLSLQKFSHEITIQIQCKPTADPKCKMYTITSGQQCKEEATRAVGEHVLDCWYDLGMLCQVL